MAKKEVNIIQKTNYPELAYYIRGIGNIKYLHELQAVLRIYGIDNGILINILRVGMGLNRKDQRSNNYILRFKVRTIILRID